MSKITFSVSNNSDNNVSIKITTVNDSHLFVGDTLVTDEEYIPNKKYVICLENVPK